LEISHKGVDVERYDRFNNMEFYVYLTISLTCLFVYYYHKTKKNIKNLLMTEKILKYEDMIHDEKYKIKFQGFQLVGAGTIWNSLGFRYSVIVGQRKLTAITTLSGICFFE